MYADASLIISDLLRPVISYLKRHCDSGGYVQLGVCIMCVRRSAYNTSALEALRRDAGDCDHKSSKNTPSKTKHRLSTIMRSL